MPCSWVQFNVKDISDIIQLSQCLQGWVVIVVGHTHPVGPIYAILVSIYVVLICVNVAFAKHFEQLWLKERYIKLLLLVVLLLIAVSIGSLAVTVSAETHHRSDVMVNSPLHLWIVCT